jgi:Tfp pilus assembly protein PilE
MSLRHRLGSEKIVIIILGILLAIALPSYLSFRLRANKSATQANVSAAVPGLEAYNADNTTGIGYEGATLGCW